MGVIEKIWIGMTIVGMGGVTISRIWLAYMKYKRAKETMQNGINDINDRLTIYKKQIPGQHEQIKKLRRDYYHYKQSQQSHWSIHG